MRASFFFTAVVASIQQHGGGASAFVAPLRTQPTRTATTTKQHAVSSASSLAVIVEEQLRSRRDCTTLPLSLVAPDIRFESDVDGSAVVESAESYGDNAARWSRDGFDLLPELEFTLLRVSALPPSDGPPAVAVNWRATWSPEALASLVALARALRWQVQRFSPPSDVVSKFSAAKLAGLFWAAFTQGTLRLPRAEVEGRALLLFDDAGAGRCVEHRESLPLLIECDAERLVNRLVASNFAAFLDVCRRPDRADPEDWAALVRRRVLPGTGAGVMDIQPNEDDSDGVVALGFFFLAFSGSLALTASFF